MQEVVSKGERLWDPRTVFECKENVPLLDCAMRLRRSLKVGVVDMPLLSPPKLARKGTICGRQSNDSG